VAEVVAKGDIVMVVVVGGALAWFRASHRHGVTCEGVCVGALVPLLEMMDRQDRYS
jgi:hypothetical protein